MNDPSHPEPEITEDDFFAALAAGDAKRAAEVLRSLKELGQGAVETLADLLEGDPVQQNFFPYRLELRRWGPGRPRNFRAVSGLRPSLTSVPTLRISIANSRPC